MQIFLMRSEYINFPLSFMVGNKKHYKSKMQEHRVTVRKRLPVSEGTTGTERKKEKEKLSDEIIDINSSSSSFPAI